MADFEKKPSSDGISSDTVHDSLADTSYTVNGEEAEAADQAANPQAEETSVLTPEPTVLTPEPPGLTPEAPGLPIKVSLANKLKALPEKPGVYIMKDENGRVIYVGKAVILKNRVRSYFQHSKGHPPKVVALVSRIADIEYILTDSEVEALILECNLIKRYRPKYNIRLVDDKSYPYIKVTVNERFPRVIMTRAYKKDGARYFGPYTNSGAVHETMKLLKKLFPLRTCKLKDFSGKNRPCLNAHIGQCLAPCSGEISPTVYDEMIKQVCLFLEGRQEGIIKGLKQNMLAASAELNFEKAAEFRDQIKALQVIVEKQKMVSEGAADQDIIALARAYGDACVQVFFVRDGKLVGREHFLLSGSEEISRSEVMTAFVKQYYSQAQFVPKEVILQEEIEEALIIAEWLRDKRGSKVRLQVPKRGEKLELVEMVARNARQVLEQLELEKLQKLDHTDEALEQLKEELELREKPRRLECYDISNTMGVESVASMVVFIDGKPANSQYRKFKIKTVEGPNDFASMEEVLARRFHRAAEEKRAIQEGELQPEEAKFTDLPDLVIIDGGKGQLGAARKSMEQLGFGYIATFGLAKEEELLFAPGRPDPIVLPRNSQALYMVQRLRDEAHRFAITYHRKLRDKRNLKSLLDDIPGIGKSRRTALLTHLKTLGAIKKASLEELASIPGMSKTAAEAVYNYFLQYRH